MEDGNNVFGVHVATVFCFIPLVTFCFVIVGHDLFSSHKFVFDRLGCRTTLGVWILPLRDFFVAGFMAGSRKVPGHQ